MSPKSALKFVGVFRVLPVIWALFFAIFTARSTYAIEVNFAQIQQRIAQEEKSISTALRDHVPGVRIAYGWERIAIDYESAADFPSAERAFTRSLEFLGNDSENAVRRAQVLDALGHLYLVYGRVDDARSVRSQALALLSRQGNALQIARARSHLAEIDLVSRRFKEAYAGSSEAYHTMTTLHDPSQIELVSTLVVLAYAQCELHDHAECLAQAQKAAELSKSVSAADEMTQGAALMALGYAELKSGDSNAAESDTEHAVEIIQRHIVRNDPRVVYGLRQERDCFLAQHNKDAANRMRRQIEDIERSSAASCGNCSVSVLAFANPRR